MSSSRALNDELAKVVAGSVAEKIVTELDSKLRDELLKDAVAHVLGTTQIRDVAGDLITRRARELAEEIITSGHFDQQIRTSLIESFGKLIQTLDAVGPAAFASAIFGSSSPSSYTKEESRLGEYMRRGGPPR